MKKHILPFLLCVILCFCAVGCSSESGNGNGNGNNGNNEPQNNYVEHEVRLNANNYEDYLFITYTYQKEQDAYLNSVHITYFITVRSRNPSYEFYGYIGYWNSLQFDWDIALVFYNKPCYLDKWGNGYLETTHKYVSPYSSVEVPKAQYAVGSVYWTTTKIN